MAFMDIFRPKLGSRKRPAIVRVKSEDMSEEMLWICVKHGWQIIVGIEPDEPEDVSDVEKLLTPFNLVLAYPKKGRNELCDCGSGKKYKKCCLLSQTVGT